MEELDPFDPASLRLDQSFTDGTAVKKVWSTIPVGRPGRQDFFRVHPGESYRLAPAAIIELKDEREIYLVQANLAAELAGEIATVTLFTTINRQNVIRLWPVRLPSSDGKTNNWHTSAADAARRAMDSWVRIQANMNLGAYDIFKASANIPEPEWPEDLSFHSMLKIAFASRFIDRADHPLIQKLRGAI
jgi:hypothetical protein